MLVFAAISTKVSGSAAAQETFERRRQVQDGTYQTGGGAVCIHPMGSERCTKGLQHDEANSDMAGCTFANAVQGQRVISLWRALESTLEPHTQPSRLAIEKASGVCLAELLLLVRARYGDAPDADDFIECRKTYHHHRISQLDHLPFA